MRYLRFVLLACALAVLVTSAALAKAPPVPPAQRAERIAGAIAEINLEKGAIVLNALEPKSGTDAPATLVFFVNDRTKIQKNGEVAPLTALAVGDFCRAAVVRTQEKTLLALSVAAKSPGPVLSWAAGTIVKIGDSVLGLEIRKTEDATPIVMEFSFGPDTKVSKNGKPATPAELAVGDLARVGYIPVATLVVGPIPAAVIEAKTPPEPVTRVCGEITKIDLENGTIGITNPNLECPEGICVQQFSVSEQTRVLKFGESSLKALMVGDKVCVGYNAMLDIYPPFAIEIVVKSEGLGGRVVNVDYENGIIVLQQSLRGPAFEFKVVEPTKIIKNGKPAELKAIVVNDFAEVRYFRFPEGNIAALIAAKSPRVLPPPGR